MEMVNTGHLVDPGRRPQSRILRCLYLLKARVTCVGAPDWCCKACDRFPQCVVDQKRVILQVDAYVAQITIDHGLQLWNLWSSSPECDVVSVENPLDRGSQPWHISYVIVEQGR